WARLGSSSWAFDFW
nr:immunoglobulin heavy chain junction region [Macaca mulatta]MOV91698.1 immunoglobulin heavy chain junction region [Macaca mulatta]